MIVMEAVFPLLQSDDSLRTQQSEMDKASKELLETKLLIQDLRNEINEKDNVIIELYSLKEKDEKNYKEMITQLNQDLQDKGETCTQRKSEMGELECDLSELQKLNAAEVEKLQCEHEEELRTLNSKHATELQNLNLLFQRQLENASNEEGKTRQEEQEAMKHMYEKEISILKTSLNEQKETNGHLEQQLESLKEECNRDFAQLREKEAMNEEELTRQNEKVKEVECSRSELVELRQKAEKLERELVCKDSDLQEVGKLNEDFLHQIQALKEELAYRLESAASDLNSSNEEKATLLEELKELRKELKKKEKQIAELEDNLSSFEEEHTSDLAQYEHSLQEQQEQTAELEKQLVLELGNESAKYKHQLAETKAQYQQTISQLTQKVGELETENETLQINSAQEMEALRENLAQYISVLEKQIQELQSGTEAKHQAELEELRHERVQAVEQVKVEHARALESLKKQVERLSEEKAALEHVKVSEENMAKLKDYYEGQIQTLKEQAVHQKESQEKELMELMDTKEKQFMVAIEELLEKHQQELAEAEETRERRQSEGAENRSVIVNQLRMEKDREMSMLKTQLLQESEERIASSQESLLFRISKEEQENLRLRDKLLNSNKELSEVTCERDRLLNEVQVLSDTHKVLGQKMAPIEPRINNVSSQIIHEELPVASESVGTLEVLPDAVFTKGNKNVSWYQTCYLLTTAQNQEK